MAISTESRQERPSRYAELHCLSNYSFLRGASHPEELVAQAIRLGYAGLAITDECSLAGAVRAHEGLKEATNNINLTPKQIDFKLIYGSEFTLKCGFKLVLLACNRAGYGNLSALITLGRRRAPKGEYQLSRGDLEGLAPAAVMPDCLALWIAHDSATDADARWFAERFRGRGWLAVELHSGPDDGGRLARLTSLADAAGLPMVATGDVHMHRRGRRPLQDILTALRHRVSVFEAGQRLFPNAERHLRHPLRLARLYPPELLTETTQLVARCDFSLDELRYEYPQEIVPPGETPTSHLRHETEAGLRWRYPRGVPEAVRQTVEKELALIAELRYEPFFLTVYDIVRFARGEGILCQGRGSAANSVVCYALGITAVDPQRASLLFERFLSKERNEPPDIDVDFEHERREIVIQHIYEKYGRERAALAATVIRYRTRSALRDVGRALGFSGEQISALTRSMAWWDKRDQLPARLRDIGLDPDGPRVAKWLALTEQLVGFPRHLSQHVGGFVISEGPIARLVPVENAAMAERSVIQWDKEDLESLGLLKVDVLALGMLSVIRRALEMVNRWRGTTLTLDTIPPKDTATFDALCAADSVGVFQVESRAQMAMLPRLKPRRFYDLVVQVAIVRPGPIQGDMVHPYLARRNDRAMAARELARLPEPVRAVLERTLGVSIFQEQVMKLAEVAAGFTPGEADELRRAMASWRRKGHMQQFKEKLRIGMKERGYPVEFSESLCRQIEGFGEYGFPESHAASFALLAYASAWLKRHEPEAFLAALLNSQPMGFYRPAQLIQDARRHGVQVLPVDVCHSGWDSALHLNGAPRPAVRLGLREIKGLNQAAGERIEVARQQAPFASLSDLATRAGLGRADLDRLAAADALQGLSGHRRDALWATAGLHRQGDLFDTAPPQEAAVHLPPQAEGESLVSDYASLGFTLGRHPLSLLRERLTAARFLRARDLLTRDHGALVRVAGIVTCRQRPGTASGVVFVTLEDETGMHNVIVHAALAERQRRELLGTRLLGVYGLLQREGRVIHVLAKRLVGLDAWLGALDTQSRDFR
ncbi:error-prone DNA polymerase [Nitrogeniibacter mangrovi]|uniref:Error-prone DNA polymerase n=1 Tax=Nitrogeniibacter mangrovi TaxID=2016596 RepID=A0A6C1B3L0_9RHOO|nr:error-prone DNA polymerase [Nitrogeniibacter mangrovi]QID17973.1 error-prone DNA polymerase [Nitrogeniibacter mangrovi]